MSYPTNLTRHGFDEKVVEPQGQGTTYLLGEAPGERESATGQPFHPYAPAGSMLERILRRAALRRDMFRIGNVVWQRPPNNYLDDRRWHDEAVETWRDYVEDDIRNSGAKVVVALGNTALRALTSFGGVGAGVGKVHSYVLSSHLPVWVVPAFHPSYLVQGGHHLIGAVRFSIEKALQIAKQGFERQPTRYVWDDYEALLRFEEGFDPLVHSLSYDIETPESHKLDEDSLVAMLEPQDEERDEEDEERPLERAYLDASYNIIRISLCYDSTGYAISVPWMPPFIEVVKRIMAKAKVTRVWNAPFDNPRLRANGVTIGGTNYDMMECFSYLQRSLPRALSFVTPFYGWTQEPWKHLNLDNPPFYSCADSHALQLNGDGIERDLKACGKWELVRRHVSEVYEVLTMMAHNGLPYSKEKASEFRIELEGKLVERQATLQQRVPEELKPSKQKSGYKKVPKDTTGLTRRKFTVLGDDLTKEEGLALGFTGVGDTMNMFTVERWCLLEPFLPTSPQQVLALIKFNKHKVGRNRKTKRESADREVLKKLMRQCRAHRKVEEQEKGATYKLIVECRRLSKVLGTYVNGWVPSPRDGRIHSTPGFWGKMYRISWRRPNIAATIADKDEEDIARGFRKCVEAREGKLLVEGDWKGMEAVLVGYFANDPDYIRLARLGVHSYMASHILRAPVDLTQPDDALRDRFNWIKQHHRKIYDDAKHCTHGIAYGAEALILADLYEMTVARAKELREMYFHLFPKVKAWQKSVLALADKEGSLTSPHNYKMWFWDVYRWDSKKFERLRAGGMSEAMARENAYSLGKDAKSAISFLPRDTGAAMLKEALLRLRLLAEEGVMLSSTHDSILTEVIESRVEEVGYRLKEEMERPVECLGGLSIGVDLKVGKSWDDGSMETLVLGGVPTCVT